MAMKLSQAAFVCASGAAYPNNKPMGASAALLKRPAGLAHLLISPAQQSNPGRGSLLAARSSALHYASEYELYQAECDFHTRALNIMRELTKNLKQEWHTYQAEWRANQLTKNLQAAAMDYAMCPGGYHPVQVGEVFNSGRYTVLHYLGQGHYSTVWMVHDAQTGQQAAMKVVRSAPNYTEAARDEVMLLQQIRDNDPDNASHCVRLLDQFEHTGPHGCHVCEVFEAMGDDLLTLIRVYEHRGIPLHIVRHLTRQTLEALDYLHTKCHIVHTDLKPENVMLAESVHPRGHAPAVTAGVPGVDLEELEPRLLRMGCKIVDFGNACWAERPFSQNIQTRQYRAPEVILGAGYNNSADIWSLACMVFELVTGDFLFQPNARGSYSKDEDHLAQMIELLGDMSPEISGTGKHAAEFFTPGGTLRHIEELNLWPLEQVLQEKYFLPAEEAQQLCDFLLPMLDFDPCKRASAKEMLQHSWLQQEQEQLARRATATSRQACPSPTRSPSFTPAPGYQHHSPLERLGAAR